MKDMNKTGRRKKKPVEVFEHRGMKVEIALNHQTGSFLAELPFDQNSVDERNPNSSFGGSDNYINRDLLELRQQLMKAIDARLDSQFKPAIYVESLGERHSGSMNLEYHRVFEAPKPGGDGMLIRQFIANGAVAEGFLPDEVDGKPGAYCYRRTGEGVTRLDYSPEKWMALRKLSEMLEKLREKINEEISDTKRLDLMLVKVQHSASFNLGFDGAAVRSKAAQKKG